MRDKLNYLLNRTRKMYEKKFLLCKIVYPRALLQGTPFTQRGSVPLIFPLYSSLDMTL
jgi:hypothetical protein